MKSAVLVTGDARRKPVVTGAVSVLFVMVSVVARPTSVSVELGSVKVPVLLIVLR